MDINNCFIAFFNEFFIFHSDHDKKKKFNFCLDKCLLFFYNKKDISL